MNTATLLQENLSGFTGEASLYKLDPPLTVKDGKTIKRVIVSAVNAMFTGPETLIFWADDDEPKVAQWTDLEGSYRGGYDHARALKGAGYTLKPVTQ